MRNAEDAKSRESPCSGPQLQRLENPLSINALNTLRDGVPCSDTMGCGRYVGFWGVGVKGARCNAVEARLYDTAFSEWVFDKKAG